MLSVWTLSLGSVFMMASLKGQTRVDTSELRVIRPEIELSPKITSEILTQAIKKDTAKDELSIDTSKLRVLQSTRLEAVDVSGKKIETKVASGVLSVAAKRGQWVVLKPERTSPVTMTEGVQWLPGMSVVADDETKSYFTYAKFAKAPVVWDLQKNAYEIVAHVGVARDADESLSGAVGRTALIKLSFDGIPVNPAEVQVDRLGVEGEKKVSFQFQQATKDAPRIVVRSNIAHEQDFKVPIEPRIFLNATRKSILGFGLSETKVTARPVDAMGRELKEFAGRDVDIKVEGGSIRGTEGLRFDQNAKATFPVISNVLGTIDIEATTRSSARSFSGSLTINTILPWAQLAAALMGGALGGFCRRFMKGADPKQAARQVIEGASVSIIAFIAGVLGVGLISLPPVVVGTVAGAFLVGAVSGFLGVVVLERISSKLIPTSEDQ